MLVKVKKSLPVLFFMFISIGIHLYFFKADTFFTARGGDSIDQYLMFHTFLHREYADGQFQWSWEYGLGGDIFGQFIYYYASSLFFWVSLLFKGDSVTTILEAKFALSLLKCFLSMLFMYLLLCYHRRSIYSSVIGALIYAGSVFFAKYSLRSDFMADAMVWLPLTILAFDRYIDRNKNLLFILAVFLIAFSNFYFAFITSVYIFVYALFKFFLAKKEFGMKSFLLYYVKIAGSYGLGLLLSSFSFLPAVYHFLHADRFSKNFDIPMLFDLSYYKNLYYQLFFSVSDLTFPVICLGLTVLGFFTKNREVKIRLFFTITILIFYLIPMTSSFFNGFSAIQFRWFYLVVFTMAFFIPFVLDHLDMKQKNLWLILIAVTGLVYLSLKGKAGLVNSYVNQDDERNFIILCFFAALIGLMKKLPKLIFQICLVLLVTVNILFNNFTFFTHELGPWQNQKPINDRLFGLYGFDNRSEQEVINYIKKRDPGFYRIMWKDVKQYNLPMLYDYNGFSAYHSLIPYNVSKFYKDKYNTLQFDSPSLFKNLDSRLYLETALSTKYYIVSNKDEFQPFGYRKLKTFKDYTVFENQNWMPLAFMTYKGVEESEFNRLNFSERDTLLLNAVVINENPKELGLRHAQISVRPLLNNGMKDLLLNGVTHEGKTFVVGAGGYIDLPVKQPEGDGEILAEIEIRSTAGKQFDLSINGKKLTKREENSTYSYPQTTFVFNLGEMKPVKPLHVTLTPGEYTIKRLKVTFTPYENLSQDVKTIQSGALKNSTITTTKVSGEVNAARRGVLSTSIPFNSGWHAWVDGKKTETFQVNSTFVGIKVPKGKHHVTLTYSSPYLKTGAGISILTLCVILIIAAVKKRKEGRQL